MRNKYLWNFFWPSELFPARINIKKPLQLIRSQCYQQNSVQCMNKLITNLKKNYDVTCPIWLSLLFLLVFLPSSGPSFPSSF